MPRTNNLCLLIRFLFIVESYFEIINEYEKGYSEAEWRNNPDSKSLSAFFLNIAHTGFMKSLKNFRYFLNCFCGVWIIFKIAHFHFIMKEEILPADESQFLIIYNNFYSLHLGICILSYAETVYERDIWKTTLWIPQFFSYYQEVLKHDLWSCWQMHGRNGNNPDSVWHHL